MCLWQVTLGLTQVQQMQLNAHKQGLYAKMRPILTNRHRILSVLQVLLRPQSCSIAD